MNAEGWYLDPYGLHDERWFSDGSPTALVRDGRTVSQDTPPTASPPVEPVRRTPLAVARVAPQSGPGHDRRARRGRRRLAQREA